jgi:tRNA A-37 threonylcarbamoyl transferase component Bud32
MPFVDVLTSARQVAENMRGLEEAADTLASRGFCHTDLRTDNLALCGGRAIFIDLSPSFVERSVPRGEAKRRMVAQLRRIVASDGKG